MKPLQGLVAALAIGAIAGCVYLIIEAGQRIYASIGPSKAVATADGTLYVVSHGFVHVFEADGRRREKFDLGEAGVTRTPSDLVVHHDGRIVIANPDGSDLARCTLSPPRCERIDPKLTRIKLQEALPLNSVKVAIDEERGRYYLSDNAGHRAVAVRFDGSRIAATEPRVLHYPNQLALDGGELRVVDTNNVRIAFFDATGDSLASLKHQMPLAARGVARAGRRWPFDALRTPSGQTWALLGDDRMKDADLVVFDAAGRAVKRIELGDDSDPFDIELWRDRVLVADATRYRVDAVSFDGKVEAAALDPQFKAELESASEVPSQWREIRVAAQVGIGLVPLLAILLLWKMGIRVTPRPRPPEPVPAGQAARLLAQPQWLEMDPGYFAAVSRRMNRAFLPGMLVGVAALGIIFFKFREAIAGDPAFIRTMAVVVGITVLHAALSPLTTVMARYALRGYRIGASSLGLHYELSKSQAPFGLSRSGRAPWRETYFDGRRLLAGRKALPVVNLDVAMFDQDAVRRLIVANIPSANLVTTRQLLARQAGPLAWILLAIIIAVLVPLLFLL
jgi:hypothetical protein